MALVGEMQYLTIGNNTYSLPSSGGSGTVTSVGISNATNGGLSVSGSPISSSGTITIGHSNVLTSAQTTSGVYPIKIDKNGHISEYGSAVTITDEKLGLTNIVAGSTYYPIIAANNETSTAVKRQYDSNGFSYHTINGTTTTYGQSILILGNSTSTGTANNKRGELRLYGTDTSYTILISGDNTSGKYVTLPNATGTLALTSDIPTVPSNIVNTITTTAGAHTAITSQTGSVSFNVPTKTSHLTNDSNFIATTKSGAYDILTVGTGTYTGQIKIKKDSNDVTFYTTIDVSHTANRTITLPDKTGTVALTSDIPTVSYPVTSVNNKTGAVSLTASDVGALPSSTTIPTKVSDLTNDSGFVTTDENVKSTAGSASTAAFYLTGSSSSTTTTGGLIKHEEIYASHNPNGAYISLGGSSFNYRGWINLYSSGASYHATLQPANNFTADRTIVLPDASGTIALQGDSIEASQLPASGVTAGTYDGGGVKTTGYYIPSVTIDTTGRITSATDLGTLIPMNTYSSGDFTYGMLLGSSSWGSALRSGSSYWQYSLSAGQTSTTITISSDAYSYYTGRDYFRVADVQAFDSVTREPIIMDWIASGLQSAGSSLTLTVSIAEAHTNNILFWPILTYCIGM